jgi:hypothetical protein
MNLRVATRASACYSPVHRSEALTASQILGWARSSAGEHYVDIVGVTGSIPVAPTILKASKFNDLLAFAISGA